MAIKFSAHDAFLE